MLNKAIKKKHDVEQMDIIDSDSIGYPYVPAYENHFRLSFASDVGLDAVLPLHH